MHKLGRPTMNFQRRSNNFKISQFNKFILLNDDP